MLILSDGFQYVRMLAVKGRLAHWIRSNLECIFIGIGLNYCPVVSRIAVADLSRNNTWWLRWSVKKMNDWLRCSSSPCPINHCPAHSSSFLLAFFFTFLSFSLPCLLCPLFSLIHSRTLPVSSCLTGSDRLYPLSVVLKSIRPGLVG